MGLFCHPVRVRPRRALTGLPIAVVSAVLVFTAGCARSGASSTAHSSASSPAAAPQQSSASGAIHFPAALFGMPTTPARLPGSLPASS
jgi:hypothetical protein